MTAPTLAEQAAECTKLLRSLYRNMAPPAFNMALDTLLAAARLAAFAEAEKVARDMADGFDQSRWTPGDVADRIAARAKEKP